MLQLPVIPQTTSSFAGMPRFVAQPTTTMLIDVPFTLSLADVITAELVETGVRIRGAHPGLGHPTLRRARHATLRM